MHNVRTNAEIDVCDLEEEEVVAAVVDVLPHVAELAAATFVYLSNSSSANEASLSISSSNTFLQSFPNSVTAKREM